MGFGITARSPPVCNPPVNTPPTMTKSDKALLKAILRDLAITAAKLFAFVISLGLIAFVVFSVMAIR